MNVELLLQVKERILQEPENFGMWDWFGDNSLNEQCNTAACIAGHACLLRGYRVVPGKSFWDVPNLARGFLELDHEQGCRLFACMNWPPQFFDAYMETKDLRIAAEIAAKRIDHFIATEGRE